MNKKLVTWSEVFAFCSNLQNGMVYGVPRGGAVLAGIAAAHNPGITLVTDPTEADYIIDDIIDSGATAKRYEGFNKPFIAMISKRGGIWVEFPWEHPDPLHDNRAIVERLLELIGEDPTREGLLDTPKRFLKAMQEMTSGYGQKPAEVLGTTFSSEGYDEIVVVKDIEFNSLCEHHLLPFGGSVHFAYIPDERIVGLSKIPRLVRLFSKRLQVQERMTKQIADAFEDVLKPRAIAVVVQGNHSCMSNRGVECLHGSMGTSVVRGVFKSDSSARAEALMLMGVR